MQKLKDWFASLQARERIAVSVAAVLVSAMVIYVLGLAPFYRSVNALETGLADRKADLAWMTGNAESVRMLVASRPQLAPTGESLVLLVDRTAREAGLGDSLTNQTPTGADGIKVNLQEATFDTMMVWLNGLQVSQGITIQSATINRASKPGVVNASLELIRAGG
jgi:type II secretory pathway component PulM